MSTIKRILKTVNRKRITWGDVVAAAIFFFIWFLAYSIADAILGWLFGDSTVWNVLWFFATVCSFIVMVVRPVYHFHNDERTRRNAAAQDDSLQWDFSTTPDYSQVSRETQTMRQAYTADINTCLADADCTWQWANSSSLSRIYLNPKGNAANAEEGTLHIVDGRVEYVSVGTHRYLNTALLEAKRGERVRMETPVVEFMKNAIPDAKWTWEDADAGVIYLSSSKVGVRDAVATLRFAKDGHITSVNIQMPDGSVRNVKNRAPASQQASRAATTTAQKSSSNSPKAKEKKTSANAKGAGEAHPAAEKREISKTRSTIVSCKKPEQAVDVLPTAEETTANLLKPTDVPPVAEDVLKRSAYQMADFDALEISELAMAAEERSETSFVRKWPEGLQTKMEAEFYAEAIVSRGAFQKAEINAENETIRFHLQVDDFGEDA